MKTRVVAALSCLLAIFTAFSLSASAEGLSATEERLIAYKLEKAGVGTVQEWIDGELTEKAGTSSDWYVLALIQSGKSYDTDKFADALSAYASTGRGDAVSRQRMALTLIACGRGDDPAVTAAAETTVGKQGTLSLVFGLHLINNGAPCPMTVDDVISDLLVARAADGGWALMGSASDTDVTAMALTALAPYCDKSEVAEAVTEALSLLSARQLDNGGFVAFGIENPESAAQVAIALSALGIDPTADSRFVKSGGSPLDFINSFSRPNGSFSHTYGGDANESATYQTLLALTAVNYAESLENGLFVFSEKPPQEPDASDVSDESLPNESKAETESESASAASAEQSSDESSASEAELPAKSESESAIRLYVCLAAALAGLCALAVMIAMKKLNRFRLIIVLTVTAAIIVAAAFIEISGTDEYYGTDTDVSGRIGTVTVTIRCDTVVGKAEHIPDDGVILAETAIGFAEGETAYDTLMRAVRAFSIRAGHNGGYITGIANINEFDFGGLSGWMYRVNGVMPSVGCDGFRLSDGDRIEWLYSLESGKDLD